jgi:hypothetical protein
MTDFGADGPFTGAAAKLKEHYGIDIPVSTIRATTEKHGEAILEKQKQGLPLGKEPGVAILITEMDGSMLPVVETAEPSETSIDRRKTRKLSWNSGTRSGLDSIPRKNVLFAQFTTSCLFSAL